jgi:ketosteroid isomerase-like protein
MNAGTIQTEVAQAHGRLLAALVDGDASALRRHLAPDCQIVGPKGYQIGTEEWVRSHSEQIYQQVALETVDSHVQHFGDTVVRSDLQRSECLYQGETITGLFRVLSVWVRHGGDWRLTALQYTAVAPEAAPA